VRRERTRRDGNNESNGSQNKLRDCRELPVTLRSRQPSMLGTDCRRVFELRITVSLTSSSSSRQHTIEAFITATADNCTTLRCRDFGLCQMFVSRYYNADLCRYHTRGLPDFWFLHLSLERPVMTRREIFYVHGSDGALYLVSNSVNILGILQLIAYDA